MENLRTRILVVEDNPADVRLMQLALEQHLDAGFQVVYEASLMDAFKRLEVERVDIILLDLFLPDALGLEAVQKIRGIHPRTPIIALTGLLDEKMGVHALKMGANHYLPKEGLKGPALVDLVKRFTRPVEEAPVQG